MDQVRVGLSGPVWREYERVARAWGMPVGDLLRQVVERGVFMVDVVLGERQELPGQRRQELPGQLRLDECEKELVSNG